jgi:AhpD family alkylhydroperoxidase
VDDELPLARAVAVADHLTRCADCSDAHAATLAAVAALREGLAPDHRGRPRGRRAA